MYAIIGNAVNKAGHGTIKFQFSKYHPMHPDPRFIPHDDKKLAENILGSTFCKFLENQYESVITGYVHNVDDSNKKPDVSFTENEELKGLQITELQFTRHEERKVLSRRISEELVAAILHLVVPKYKMIVNIFPVDSGAILPLSTVKKGKTKILQELAVYVARTIAENQDKFTTEDAPIWHHIEHTKLSPHYRTICLNKVPAGCYPRFHGRENVYVNYDMDDVSFTDNEATEAINAIFKKKNNGKANMLLIWSDEFELATINKRTIAERIFATFQASTFDEVFFMTFRNTLPDFLKSLELWVLKGKRVPMKEVVVDDREEAL